MGALYSRVLKRRKTRMYKESTEVVTLRPLAAPDAPRLFELIDRNRPQLAKFWWERQTITTADSEAFIIGVNEAERRNGAPTRGIYLNEALIGVAALHTIDWQKRTSLLGYWLDKEQSGHGYASEAARQLLTQEAFGRLALHEVYIDTRETNTASRAIAEKLGFNLVEVSNEPLWKTEETLVSTALYRLSKDDYYRI